MIKPQNGGNSGRMRNLPASKEGRLGNQSENLFITSERLSALERKNYLAFLVWSKWIEIGRATLLEGEHGSQ